jgi:hypothetical protein
MFAGPALGALAVVFQGGAILSLRACYGMGLVCKYLSGGTGARHVRN